MGNGYEPSQNRSWFGGRSGARLLGKAEKDTSSLRRSEGAESKGGLTPSRETQPMECRPSSDRDSFSSPATSLGTRDRKSTRLNSSHSQISYAVFCLKKKKK